MRATRFICPIICCVFLGYGRGLEATPEPGLVVSAWPHNAPAAFSLTLDDCLGSQYTLAAPVLSEVGVKATFFVITKYLDSRLYDVGWEEFKALSDSGHEIGSHSEYHPDFSTVDSATAYAELKNSKIAIEKKIGKPCRFFAWPYGRRRDLTSALAGQVYVGARGVGEKPEADTPHDPLYVQASGNSETFGPFRDSTLAGNGWLVRVIHKVGDSVNEVSTSALKEMLLDVKARDFWIAPFGEAFLYAKTRATARLASDGHSDSTMAIKLERSTTDSLLDVPLTIGVKLPPSWGAVECRQAGRDRWQRFEIREGAPWVWTEIRQNPDPLIISRLAVRSDTVSPTLTLGEAPDELQCGKPIVFNLDEPAEVFLDTATRESRASKTPIRSGEIAKCDEPSYLYAIDEAGNISNRFLVRPVAVGTKGKSAPKRLSRWQPRKAIVPVADGFRDIMGRFND